MAAVMQKTPANVQPNNRGPTSEAGWATATGRTKVNSAAVDAVAAWGDTIPANSTAKPDHRHRDDGGHLVGRHHRAEHGEAGAHDEEPSVRGQPDVGTPGELHQEKECERAEGAEQRDLRVRENRMREREDQWG